MNNFISTVYKETRVLPFSKGLETAVYKLPPVIHQRIKDKAVKWGYAASDIDGSLLIHFKD